MVAEAKIAGAACAVAWALVIGSTATAAELLCTRQGAADITISLNSRTAFGHTLSCIAGDFVQDMTPCAPAGGYGLSAPTGDARLVGVVIDWHDPAYAHHSGGFVQFVSTPDSYNFYGGTQWFGTLTPGWQFEVSRLTGRGVLTGRGLTTGMYECHAARQKF